MSSVLSESDIELVCGQLGRFVQGEIAPLVERHETTVSPEALDNLVAQALETGFLALGEISGMGLWEQGGEPPLLSVRMLAAISEVNSGVALRFHQFALARYLLQSLSFSALDAGSVATMLQGYYGLGRTALPRYLSGRELLEGDADFLQQWLAGDGSAPFVINTEQGWQKLLHPQITADGDLSFVLREREGLAIDEVFNNHGLNELSMFCCSQLDECPGERSVADSDQCKAIYVDALLINALGLMAIALGAVRRGQRMAFDYAAIREQGGDKINRHAAVQLMLGSVRSAIDSATAELEQLSSSRLQVELLPRLFAIRSAFHPKLSDAANACMQIFGGIGYMRDTGIEKIIRDCNALRQMGGTPAELSLFVSEWERLHA